MTFKQFLEIEGIDANHRFCDFYKDTLRDGMFPWEKTFEEQQKHLEFMNADEVVLKVHKEAYQQYKKINA